MMEMTLNFRFIISILCGVLLLSACGGGKEVRSARHDQAAEFKETDAKAIDPRIAAFDEAAAGHGTQDAVGRGRVQPGFCRKLLERNRVVVPGQDVEQRHHALNDLNRILRGFLRGQRIFCQ